MVRHSNHRFSTAGRVGRAGLAFDVTSNQGKRLKEAALRTPSRCPRPRACRKPVITVPVGRYGARRAMHRPPAPPRTGPCREGDATDSGCRGAPGGATATGCRGRRAARRAGAVATPPSATRIPSEGPGACAAPACAHGSQTYGSASACPGVPARKRSRYRLGRRETVELVVRHPHHRPAHGHVGRSPSSSRRRGSPPPRAIPCSGTPRRASAPASTNPCGTTFSRCEPRLPCSPSPRSSCGGLPRP